MVPFYGVYKTPLQEYFWVMGLCKQSLQEALQPVLSQGVPWPSLWEWALGISEGLFYLHDNGVLHRDLKADNILIDACNRACLIDLGLADIDESFREKAAKLVRRGVQCRSFKAPEAIVDWTHSSRETDVYALGLVFWQIVTGGKIPSRTTWQWLKENTKERWEEISKKLPSPELQKQCEALIKGGVNTDPIPTDCRDAFSKIILPSLEGLEREEIPSECPLCFKQLILDCWAVDPQQRPKARTIIERLLSMGTRGEIPGLTPERALFLSFWHKADQLIHSKRSEMLSYVPPDVISDPIKTDMNIFEKFHLRKRGKGSLSLGNVFLAFLEDHKASTLVLFGKPGSGKTLSLYAVANDLLEQSWRNVHSSYFPILLRPVLGRWSHAELTGALGKALREHGGVHPFMRLVFFIDGYDECLKDKEPCNLPQQLRLRSFPGAKLVVTCRDQTEPTQRFWDGRDSSLWMRYFLPFNDEQINQYLEKTLYLKAEVLKDYQQKLKEANYLDGILRTPFVLSLFAKSCDPQEALAGRTRRSIYHKFIAHWTESPKSTLQEEVRKELTTASFEEFAGEIALNAFNKGLTLLEEGNIPPLLQSSPWHRLEELILAKSKEHFSRGSHILTLEDFQNIELRRIIQFLSPSPLKKRLSSRGYVYEFRNASFFSYCLAEAILSFTHRGAVISRLNERPLQEEPNVLMFIKEAWMTEAEGRRLEKLEGTLWGVVELSKARDDITQAAANAVTILNALRFSFSEKDLRHAKLKGADLRYGIFDGTQFQEADLRNVNFQGAWLSRAIFEEAKMEGVILGQRPFLTLQSSVKSLCYSLDGEKLAVFHPALHSTLHDAITLFKSNTREEIASFAIPSALLLANPPSQPSQPSQRIAFSHDSQKIAVASGQAIYLWKVDGGAPPKEIKSNHSIISFTQNGQLASGGENTVSFWGEDGKSFAEWSLPAPNIECFAFCSSPDTPYKFVYGASAFPYIRLMDAQSGKTECELFKENQGRASLISFPPKGDYIAALCFQEGVFSSRVIQVWDTKGELHRIFSHKNTDDLEGLNGMSFSLEGRLLASSAGHFIYLWDIETGQLVHELSGHRGLVQSVAFNPTKLELASGSEDHTVRFWDTTLSLTSLTGESSTPYSLAFHSDGRTLVSGHEDGIARLWNTKEGRLTHSFREHRFPVLSVALDGNLLATGGGEPTVCLLDISAKTKFQNLEGQGTHLAFLSHGDQKYLFSTGDHDATARLWSLKGETEPRQPVLRTQGRCKVTAVAARLDLPWVALGYEDGCIIMKNMITPHEPLQGNEILRAHRERQVNGIAFHPTDLLFAAAYETQDLKHQVHLGHFKEEERKWRLYDLTGYSYPGKILSVAYSPDGTLLALGGSNGVHLWDTETRDVKRVIKGFLEPVNSICFQPSSNSGSRSDFHLATASQDNAVRYWKITKPHLDSSLQITLLWNSYQSALATLESIATASGLSAENAEHLKQCG